MICRGPLRNEDPNTKLYFFSFRRKKKKTYYASSPTPLSKIDNLDNMKNNQKQQQDSPLLIKNSMSDLEKAPTPTYPRNFTYNCDAVDKKDGSPALIGGMKNRKNKAQKLGVNGHVYEDNDTFPLSSESADNAQQRLRAPDPYNHINAESPSNDWKPLLPPSPSPQGLVTFQPPGTNSGTSVPQTMSPSERPNTLPVGLPNGDVPPPVAPRVPVHRGGNTAAPYKPKPPPSPKCRGRMTVTPRCRYTPRPPRRKNIWEVTLVPEANHAVGTQRVRGCWSTATNC